MTYQRTEQQVAADDLIEEAIKTAAVAYGFGEDGKFVGDWMIVAELPDIETGRSNYGWFIPGDHMPEHRARGLAAVAQQAVDLHYAPTDDEDD